MNRLLASLLLLVVLTIAGCGDGDDDDDGKPEPTCDEACFIERDGCYDVCGFGAVEDRMDCRSDCVSEFIDCRLACE